MPGEHAYFAPSASPRWLACPGSLALSEGIKESTSPYAHEGTICHEIAARCLKENLTAEDFSGQMIENVVMTEELIEGIQMYVDEVRGQTKELGTKGGKIEHTVNITEDCWGTLDAMLWNDDLLVIDDLKMGKGVIVEGDTPQMKVYAVGALKWLQQEHGLAPQHIHTFIIQPRTVNPIRKQEYTRAELLAWYNEELVPTMQAIKDGSVECIPGVTQCKWCPAKGMCTAQAEFAIREAAQAFKPYTEAGTPEIPDIHNTPLLDIGGMAVLKKVFPFIHDWIKAIDAHLMDTALAGDPIPGFKLVEGRSNRKWKADDVVVEAFLKKYGLEPFKKTLKTAPAVEKEIGKKKAKTLKLDEYIIKPKGSPVLVDESDKRPEMSLKEDVEVEFEEFVESSPIVVETEGSFDSGDESKELTLMQKLAMGDLDDLPEESEKPDTAIVEDVAVFSEFLVSEFMDVLKNADGTVKQMGVTPLTPAEIMEIAENRKDQPETATSGNPEVSLIQSATPNPKPVAPKPSTKRYKVLTMGKGGASLEEVAKVLNTGVNSVKMHIRYLHERDGYGYELYSNETFKIIE